MHIVILSRKPHNLIPCVESIFRNEPELPRENIIVVDDGAKEKAEEYLPGITWLSGIKPFIFARNANLGLTYANDDTVLLNDDTELASPQGFTKLCTQGQHYGLLSAAIDGLVGCHDQKVRPNSTTGSRVIFGGKIAFVAVLIRKYVFQQLGPLDETFTKYGFDDTDYCVRLQTDLSGRDSWLGVCDECVVKHFHPERSSFHGPTGNYDGDNYDRFREKWGWMASVAAAPIKHTK